MDATPTDVVRQAFAALDRHQWRVVARLLAPESLATMRSRHLGMLASIEMHLKTAGTRTGGGSIVALLHPPGDFLVRFGSVKVRVFPGSPTIGELARLSPEDFHVRWQEACYKATLPLRVYGALWRLFHRTKKKNGPVVLGAVTEGDDLAHVVYREPGYVHPWQAEVLSLKRDQAAWRLQLGEFPGLDPFRRGDHMLMGRAMLGSMLGSLIKSKITSWFRFIRSRS